MNRWCRRIVIGAALLLATVGFLPASAAATAAVDQPTSLCLTSTDPGSESESDPESESSSTQDQADDRFPLEPQVTQAEVDELVSQHIAIDATNVGRRQAAMALFEQGSAIASTNSGEAELRLRAAFQLDPARTDIQAAIIALTTTDAEASEPDSPTVAPAFADALELLLCNDEAVQVDGIELAIEIAKANSIAIPSAIEAQYPDDQRPYIEADRLLAGGRESDARALAHRIAGPDIGPNDPTLPQRYRQTRWQRSVDWVTNLADTVTDTLVPLLSFGAVIASAGWIALQLLKKAKRHWFRNREIRVALGDFSDGSDINGAAAAAKAVVTRELQFASGQSHSLDAVDGAAAPLGTVELPTQLKVLGPLLDWARRGPRYSLVASIHRTSDNTVAIHGEVHNVKGKSIAAASFTETVLGDNEIDAINKASIDFAGWLAFEVIRLRRWPRIRQGLSEAPRLLGTERTESYQLYRQAMQGPKPDKALLEHSLAVSPNNYAALMELGKLRVRGAIPADHTWLRHDSTAYTDEILGGLEQLARALELVERYPTVKPRAIWSAKKFAINLEPFARHLVKNGVTIKDDPKVDWPSSDHRGVPKYSNVDPMWFQATFRLAVAHFHAFAVLQRSDFELSGESEKHLRASGELSVALAKAVGATHHAIVGTRLGRMKAAFVIPGLANRIALVELTQRDGAYFASILAGVRRAAKDEKVYWDYPGKENKFETVEAADERLLERLASGSYDLTLGQLEQEFEPFRERDFRIGYNIAVSLAQDVDHLSNLPTKLQCALLRMPLPVLRQHVDWFRNDPSMIMAWREYEEEMRKTFDRIDARIASAAERNSASAQEPTWVDGLVSHGG